MGELVQVSDVMYEGEGSYFIKCPGCKSWHPFNVDPSRPQVWQFNGDVNKPTFTPSLLVNGSHPESRCHLFLTNGKIQFLSDCHHELAGQTVDMVSMGDDD